MPDEQWMKCVGHIQGWGNSRTYSYHFGPRGILSGTGYLPYSVEPYRMLSTEAFLQGFAKEIVNNEDNLTISSMP